MRADRLLSMMLMLQSHRRMTAQELSSELGVSERTIYRDVEALSFAGIPVYTQTGINGGIFLDEEYRVSLAALNKHDIQALFATSGHSPLDDLGLKSDNALLKLLSMLPAIHRNEADYIRQRLYIDPANWFTDDEPPQSLPLVQVAVWDDRRIEMDYQRSDGSATHRIVDAYGLVAKNNVWYMVGRKDSGEFRTYRVSRIKEAELVAGRFDREPEFDLVTYWHAAAQEFRSMMEGDSAPYPVTMQVHPEVVWVFSDIFGGNYTRLSVTAEWVTIQVTYASKMSARMNLGSMGTYVKIIEPAELRNEIVYQAQSIIDLYQD